MRILGRGRGTKVALVHYPGIHRYARNASLSVHTTAAELHVSGRQECIGKKRPEFFPSRSLSTKFQCPNLAYWPGLGVGIAPGVGLPTGAVPVGDGGVPLGEVVLGLVPGVLGETLPGAVL